jgi:hypothetical protein
MGILLVLMTRESQQVLKANNVQFLSKPLPMSVDGEHRYIGEAPASDLARASLVLKSLLTL